jgi:hypothetical protein
MNRFRHYALRAAVFCSIFLPLLAAGVALSLTTVVPDSYALRHDAVRLRDWIRDELRGMPPAGADVDLARLRLTSALTRSAEVHYRMSYVEERDGNLEKAVDELELAVGIAELHAHDAASLARLHDRRDELLRKLAVRRSNRR